MSFLSSAKLIRFFDVEIVDGRTYTGRPRVLAIVSTCCNERQISSNLHLQFVSGRAATTIRNISTTFIFLPTCAERRKRTRASTVIAKLAESFISCAERRLLTIVTVYSGEDSWECVRLRRRRVSVLSKFKKCNRQIRVESCAALASIKFRVAARLDVAKR